MILFKEILTFYELHYRDDSLTTLYLVALGIIISKKWLGYHKRNVKTRLIWTYKRKMITIIELIRFLIHN